MLGLSYSYGADRMAESFLKLSFSLRVRQMMA